MNNWKLRAQYQGDNDSDYIEVNGYLAAPTNSEPMMRVVPFGNVYAAPLRTAASETHGPVSNQVLGICNGTFTHTTSANGQVASTTLTGEGSGATFFYSFLADGTLSSITAATAGSAYKVGDKLQITTNQGHVIEFRLVDGSNATTVSFRLIHDRQNPTPFPVHRAKCVETSGEFSFNVCDRRSTQVFPRPQDKLLDKYPDAAAAYGLRKLRSAYLGPAIRVRKDGAGVPGTPEKDIYFDAQGNLDTTALLDFIGDKSARVKIWYDQSGNGNDASQTANAPQPTLVSNGVIETVNGKPALKFDGTLDSLSIDSSDLYGQARFDAYFHIESADTQYLMFSQASSGGNHSLAILDGSDSTALASGYLYNSTDLYVNGVNINYVSGTTTRDDIHTAFITNGAEHSTGAIIVHENAKTETWTNFLISAYFGYVFDGKMTEMVLYKTDQSANRENIEKDMALHSGAYQVEDAPLLDAYGGAHAAYSLRKLNSDYTGPAIRVRANRSGSPEQDIGFNADGTLDTAALFAFVGDTNGNIKTWYDQSGNGNHVTQTTNASQPQIVSALNTLRQVDGRPAARFNGDDSFTFDNTGLDIGNMSSFAVLKLSSTTGTQRVIQLSGTAVTDTNFYAPVISSGSFLYKYAGVSRTTPANTANNLHTMIAGATQGDAEAFLNGTSVGTATLGSGISGAAGIGGVGSDFLNGFIQEVVVYSSDQSERRQGIERNISNHYDL